MSTWARVSVKLSTSTREYSTWGDLVKNFTDITRGTELYSKMISQNISPDWVNEPEMVSHDTVLSRTGGEDYNCTTCTTPHPVIKKWKGLVLAMTEQQFPAYLPPCDGKCMAIARHANLGMMNLSNLTILAMHKQC